MMNRKIVYCKALHYFLALFLGLAAGMLPQSVTAVMVDIIVEKEEIAAPVRIAYDHFGAAVAVDGGKMAIGAPRYDSYLWDSGVVYLYEKKVGKWQRQKIIQPPIPRQHGLFGHAIQIEGDYLIVGEPGDSNRQNGCVHVFHRNRGGVGNWGWVRTIARPDDCHLRNRDKFGYALSVDNGKLLVGAPHACQSRQQWGKTTGAAYLYDNYGSAFVRKLIAHNGEEYDFYGAAVAVCGENAFVGAPDSDSGLARANSGSAYIYTHDNNWREYQYLRPGDTLENDGFGRSIACDGRYIAVGAPGINSFYGNALRRGSVHIHQKSDKSGGLWKRMEKLQGDNYYQPESEKNFQFGSSISLRNNFLIAGYGKSTEKLIEREPAAQVFTLLSGKWKSMKAITSKKDMSCETSAYDTGFSVATDGFNSVVGDMENQSTKENCSMGLGGAKIYEKVSREIQTFPAIYLLLKAD